MGGSSVSNPRCLTEDAVSSGIHFILFPLCFPFVFHIFLKRQMVSNIKPVCIRTIKSNKENSLSFFVFFVNEIIKNIYGLSFTIVFLWSFLWNLVHNLLFFFHISRYWKMIWHDPPKWMFVHQLRPRTREPVNSGTHSFLFLFFYFWVSYFYFLKDDRRSSS